jgi:hypothetical protein
MSRGSSGKRANRHTTEGDDFRIIRVIKGSVVSASASFSTGHQNSENCSLCIEASSLREEVAQEKPKNCELAVVFDSPFAFRVRSCHLNWSVVVGGKQITTVNCKGQTKSVNH